MGFPVFTDDWAKVWEDKVKESADFPVYNKGWEGDIGCVIDADPERGVPDTLYLYMHFEDGKVLAIRMCDEETARNSKFVMSGPYIRWKQVGKGELDAVKGLMQGKLKVKGSLPYMVKYVKGVQEVVRCLTLLDSEYPDE